MTSRGAITVTASVALLIVLAGFTVADAGSRGSGDNRSAAADNRNPAADNGNDTADTGDAPGNDQVCDATADYFLGAEDYREAIATHRRVLAAHPDDALQ